MIEHYGTDDLVTVVDNHFIELGSDIGFYDDLGNDRFKDVFGVDAQVSFVDGVHQPFAHFGKGTHWVYHQLSASAFIHQPPSLGVVA